MINCGVIILFRSTLLDKTVRPNDASGRKPTRKKFSHNLKTRITCKPKLIQSISKFIVAKKDNIIKYWKVYASIVLDVICIIADKFFFRVSNPRREQQDQKKLSAGLNKYPEKNSVNEKKEHFVLAKT